MTKRSDTGQWGEAIAAKHLENKGYVVRVRNWRHDHGELDLIVERDGEIVFVEVRARHGDAFGRPEETLTTRKRAKLIATAEAYLAVHDLFDVQWQIDVIAIDLDAHNNVTRLEHYENAIERKS
jgi:putative endonuclease